MKTSLNKHKRSAAGLLIAVIFDVVSNHKTGKA